MMLMTKFGKFKLRLIATINLSALMAIFNIVSASSNYWIKYVDTESSSIDAGGAVPHVAGLWRSCASGVGGQLGNCQWKNGILSSTHSIWSILVRFLNVAGTIGNVAAVVLLCLALYYKLNKKSKCAIKLMEWSNVLLYGSFVSILVGFSVFISGECNFSLWLHVAAMCLVLGSSNLVTRFFARLYYTNTRKSSRAAGVEAGCCTADEKIALAQVVDKETNTANGVVEPQMSPVEASNKVSEKHGSNEALLPAQTTASAQPDGVTATTETTTTATN